MDWARRYEVPEQRSRKRIRSPSSTSSASTSASSSAESSTSTCSGIALHAPMPKTSKVDLTCSTLIALRDNENGLDSNAATNGADPKRIKALLRDGECGCQHACFKHIPQRVALITCRLFWDLSKAAQDSLLWSMQATPCTDGSDDEHSLAHRHQWYIRGAMTRVDKRTVGF